MNRAAAESTTAPALVNGFEFIDLHHPNFDDYGLYGVGWHIVSVEDP